jgi:hypothetical protein
VRRSVIFGTDLEQHMNDRYSKAGLGTSAPKTTTTDSRRHERHTQFVVHPIASEVNMKNKKTVSINRNSISEDRMDRFDSAWTALQRSGGLGSRLSAVFAMLLTLFAASSVAIAQPTLTHTGPTPPAGPFIAGQICAGNAPSFQIATNALPTVVYGANAQAWPGLEGFGAANAIPIGVGAGFIGDDQVYQIGAAAIAAEAGGAFNVDFYGETHNLSAQGIFVGTNGFLRFQDGDPNNDANVEFFQTGIVAQGIPAAGGVNGAIYFLNIDLAPQAGEGVYWDIQNVNGGPALVVTFDNVSQYNPLLAYPYNQVTVQVIVYPNNHVNFPNRIEVRLEDWPDPGVIPDRNHTIGVENKCGNAATAANANHNNDPWANANGAGEAALYSVYFDPANGAAQTYNARLYVVGPNGVINTYGNGAAQGDDLQRSGLVGGTSGVNQAITANTNLTTSTILGQRQYFVGLQYANCGIAVSNIVTITVNPTPTQTTITGPNAACVGTLYNFSVPLTNGNDYTWSTSDGGATVNPAPQTVNGNQASITFATGSNAGTVQTVTCVEETPVGCQVTHVVKNVTVYTVPNGTITGPTPVCANQSGTVYSISGGPYGAYQWSVTGAPAGTTTGSTTSTTFTVNWGDFAQPNAPVVATINVTVTNGGLCQFVATGYPVTVNPRPPVKTITASDNTPCVNQTINYSVPNTAGNSYAWTAAGGSFTYVAPNAGYVNGTPTLGLNSINLQWTDGGGGRSVTLVESTAAGCTRTTNITGIVVENLPTPTVTGPSINVCGYVAPSVGNPSYQTQPNPREHTYAVALPVSGNTYAWTIAGGTIVAVNGSGVIGGGGTTATGLNATQITVRWINPTPGPVVRTVQVVETSPNNCQGTSPVFNVSTVHSPIASDFSLSGAGIGGAPNPCANATGVVYTAATGLAGVTHQFFVLSGGTLASSTAVTGTVNWGNSATGIIRHEITSADGCTAWEDYTITIQPLPDATINGLSFGNSICSGNSDFYYISNQTNWASNTWSIAADPGAVVTFSLQGNFFGGFPGDEFFVVYGNNPAPPSSPVTIQNILTGPGPSNCTKTITFVVTVKHVPANPIITGPQGGAAPYVCAGQTYNYTVTGIAGGLTQISVTNGTPSQTNFNGAGPHNFTVTWGLVPGGGAGNIEATVTLNNCSSGTTNYPITISPLPAEPIFEYSLDNIVYSSTPPPLCETNVPYYIRIANSTPGITYTFTHVYSGPGGAPAFIISTVGGGGTNDLQTITNWNGAHSIFFPIAKSVDDITGCTSNGSYANFGGGWTAGVNSPVAPVPTPVISGPTAACNNTSNPLGQNGAAIDANIESKVYEYSTPYVAGNQYAWTVTNGYVVGYSVNNGPYTYFNPVMTTTGGPILGANKIKVVFYGNTPGAVKVSEIAPGGCQATTLDYLVNLNSIPIVQVLTPANTDICAMDNAQVTLNGSEAGYTYRVEISSNGGTTWTVSTAATWVGTGGAHVFTIPAADLPYTATPPNMTTYTVRVRAQTPAPPLVCGWYVASNNVTVDVNPKPAANIPVSIAQNEVCFGDNVEILVGQNVGIGSEPWVEYRLQRRQIRDLTTGAPLVGAWGYVGSAATGNGGQISLYDNSNPPGGVPLTSADNYEYQVEAVTDWAFAPPPDKQCTTFLTQTTDARIFALPTDPTVTFSPNPVCWEENVTINLTNTQQGVQYEVNIGGSSIGAPHGPVIINGNGGNAFAVVNSVGFQPTNPVGSTIVPNVQVRAYLANYAPYSRPIPVGGCPVQYGTTNLTVLEKPVAEINGPSVVCGPSTTDYTPTPVTPAPGTYDWLITNTPDAAPAGTTPMVANNTGANTVDPYTVNWGVNLLSCDGTYNPLNTTIRMIATNANGCADTAFLPVTINPTVHDAAVTGDPTACIYGGFEDHLETYTIERPGICVFPVGTAFLWTMPTGAVSGAIRSGQGTTSIVAEWYTTGGTNIGTVTCDVTLPVSHGGCVTTRTLDVVVYPLPQPVINGPDDVCAGQTGVVYTADNYPSDMYLWEVLGGTVVGGTGAGVAGNLGTRSGVGLNVITINWLNQANNNAYIKLTQTSTAGCMNETIFYVTVHPNPVPSIDGPGTVCDNAVVSYSTANNAPANTYNWSISGNATIQLGSNQATVQVLTGAIGGGNSFTLTLKEKTVATGCETTVVRVISIVATPKPTITRISPLPGAVGGACLNQEVEYGNTDPTPGTYSYKWTVQNGTLNALTPDNGATIKVTWNTVGTGKLTLAKWHTGTQCTTTVSQDVNITERPQPAISGPTVVCGKETHNYSTPFVVGNTYAWTVTGAGTLVSGANSNAIIVQFTNPASITPGSSTITVTETNTLSGCAASANVTVTVNYMPQATAINGQSPVCNGDVKTYSIAGEPAGLTYQWTITGGTIVANNGSSIDVKWATVGNHTIEVLIKNPGTNCEITLTRMVTVEFNPNPAISGDTQVCQDEVEIYSTPYNAGSSYAWVVTGGTITSGQASNVITVKWTTAGNQTVQVTETNASGNCFKVATLNVTVFVTPAANGIQRLDAGNVKHACEGYTYTYGTNAANPQNFNWKWFVTGGQFVGSSTNPTAQVKWTQTGNQVLRVTITTPGTDCEITLEEIVSVTPTPQPNIDGAKVACINKDHVYQTPFVPGNTYQWSITPSNVFATITGYPNSNVIEVKWIQPGLHTVTLTETNVAGGCATTVSIQVQVNLIPTPFITSTTGYGNPPGRRPGIVCNFSTHTYTTFATPGNTFIWTVTGGTIASGQYTNTISVQWGPSGIGTIAVQETIPGSDCITTKRDTIDIRPTPTPVITGNGDPCGSSIQTYSTPFVNGNSWTWTVVGGTILNGQNTNQITVLWNNTVWPNTLAGSVAVTEWVTDVLPFQTCIASTSRNITVRPNPPVPTITGPAVVCATDLTDSPQTINTVTYSTSIPTQGSAQGFISYQWSVSNNGTILGGATGTSINVQWTNTGSTPTSGSVTVVHTSTFGCTASNTLSVTINPLPNPIISGTRSVCQNSVHTYSTPGFPGHLYTWTVGGGNIIRSGQGSPNVSVQWTLPGTYTLQVSETNIYGCTVINRINVTVNELPSAKITASGPTTFCQGGDVTLSAPIGYASYIWSTGETARSIVVRTTGQYWVVVTDANGCSNNSDTITVNVFPSSLPIISVSGPTTFCEGGSVVLTAPSGFNAYLWSTGETTQSITVTKSGSYTVTVAAANGCTGTSVEVDVFVNPKPAPILTVVGSTTVCSGDSVEVRAPNGYTSYTWVSTSGTNYGTTRSIWVKQTDTVYCQVVDANGCVGESDKVAITVSPSMEPIIEPLGPTTFCEGGAVTLSAPTGYATYYWSNGATTREITVTDAGSYTVRVSNAVSCEAVSPATDVNVNPLPARPRITRTGDELFAVTTVAEEYQWYRNGVMIPGATNSSLVVSQPGTYRVGIADNNTCQSISDGFDVILTDVAEEGPVAGYGSDIYVFPNPTNGQFTVETEITQPGAVKIELVNILGETVLTVNENTNGGLFSTSVDMGTLASGTYHVVLTSSNQRWTVQLVRH